MMKTHPARVPLLVGLRDGARSWAEQSKERVSLALPAFARSIRMQTAFAMSLFLLIGGVGTSYAAENSLPGDFLYPLKIHVNEPIQGALQTSPRAQAHWSAEIATRRLEEAEALAATGKLTPAIQTDLTAQVDQATKHFNTDVAELSAAPGNAAALADVESTMQATLDVHAQVLNQLGELVPESKAELEPIIVHLESDTIASLGNANDSQTPESPERAARSQAPDPNSGRISARHRIFVARIQSASSSPAQESAAGFAQITGTSTITADGAQAPSSESDTYREELRSQIANQLKSTTGITLPTYTYSTTTPGGDNTIPASIEVRGSIRLDTLKHYPHTGH